MEKRTILALVLSFVILIAWSYFFTPQKKESPEKGRTGEEKTPALVQKQPQAVEKTTPAIQEASEAVEAVKDVEPGAELKDIVIDTPLYHAVFTNAGPTIKSFKLKKYLQTKDAGSPLIELVTLEKDEDKFLSINFESVHGEKADNFVYHVDKDVLNLGPGSSPGSLIFTASRPNGISITQTYRFYPDRYGIDLKVDFINRGEQSIEGNLSARLRVLLPKGESKYYSFVGLAVLIDNKLEEVEVEKVSEDEILKGQIEWMAYEDDYFISALIPDEPSKAIFTGRLHDSGVLEGIYSSSNVSIGPTMGISQSYGLYFGPRDLGILKNHENKLERAISFGWTDIIAKPLLYVLRFFNQFINNYGVSIILLTILIKILFWPLTHKSYKSMKEMQKLQPRMAKIREKYKGDKQKLNQEMMALYKTYKVNPMSGCFPMLIQIPVFFALFRILGSAIELRHAPFMLWIDDLSAPDRLFHFSFSIPFMSPPAGIPVLTLLMGASMFIQQKMTPTPGDPTQAKIMMFLPIIFTFMFINFPSGLVLYWLVNNILSIGQQYRIHKGSA